MFSKFFINRPIFATVLSIVITLAGGISLFTLRSRNIPRSRRQRSKSRRRILAPTPSGGRHGGAPIEQQVNGVENMLYMSSQCTNDGTTF